MMSHTRRHRRGQAGLPRLLPHQQGRAHRDALPHARRDEGPARRLLEAIVEEYGAPTARVGFMADHPARVLLNMAQVLEAYDFTRRVGIAEVVMEPLGVAGLITPWNSDAGFICGKLVAAIAVGCTRSSS
jgi:aldehyde dehydrogenase (NAD+)